MFSPTRPTSVTVGLNELRGTADLLLYDIYGKLLSKQRTSQLNTKVDISSLSSGTYIIRIRNNGKETNLKIVTMIELSNYKESSLTREAFIHSVKAKAWYIKFNLITGWFYCTCLNH